RDVRADHGADLAGEPALAGLRPERPHDGQAGQGSPLQVTPTRSFMWFVCSPGGLVVLLAALLAATGPAHAETAEGKGKRVPWSGYWWPYNEGRMVDPLSCYDLCVGGTNARSWEEKHHPKGGPAGTDWWGYCHAWSAAAVWEFEPTRAVN